MDALMWNITLMGLAVCPRGCGWSTTADTIEARAAALAAHLASGCPLK